MLKFEDSNISSIGLFLRVKNIELVLERLIFVFIFCPVPVSEMWFSKGFMNVLHWLLAES